MTYVNPTPSASFPAASWDGTAEGRPRLDQVQDPSEHDFGKLRAEVMAMQKPRFCIQFAGGDDSAMEDASFGYVGASNLVKWIAPAACVVRSITLLADAACTVDLLGVEHTLEADVPLLYSTPIPMAALAEAEPVFNSAAGAWIGIWMDVVLA